MTALEYWIWLTFGINVNLSSQLMSIVEFDLGYGLRHWPIVDVH